MDDKDCDCHGDGCGCCNSSGASILYKGLAVMFIFIGLTIFVGFVLSVLLNRAPIVISGFGAGWVSNIVGLLVGLWVLSWIFRMIFRRHGRCGCGCGCGCGCCGKDGKCTCGDDCTCGCNDTGAMDKKEKVAKVTRKRK